MRVAPLRQNPLYWMTPAPFARPMSLTTGPADLPALLDHFPSLQGLEGTLHARLARDLNWLHAPPGTQLFVSGDRCQAFPLLIEGVIQVVRGTPDGHEIELYRLHPGESCIVSTSCLLGEAQYPARGQTLAPARLATLPHPLFDALLAAHPPFRRYVFGLFAERLSLMMQRIEEIAFRSLARRITALLLASDAGALHITHERLAAQIGASREAVSRTLKKLEEAGGIRLARGRIDVVDRNLLAKAG